MSSKPFKNDTITTTGSNGSATGEVTFTACNGFLMRVYAEETGEPDTAVLTLTDDETGFVIMAATMAAFAAAGGSLAVRLPDHDDAGTELSSSSPYFMTGVHNAEDRTITAAVTLGDSAGTVEVSLQFAGREGL